MNPDTVTSCLDALRHYASVTGVVLTSGGEVVYSDTTLGAAALKDLVSTLDDMVYYYQQEKRSPDQFHFGYDGGNILVLIMDELRFLVAFQAHEESDHIARSAHSFLKDFALSQLLV